MLAENHSNGLPLRERLIEGAYLMISEVDALKAVCKSRVYVDMKEGRLPFVMFGASRRIPGPAAKAYVPGVGVVTKSEAAP